MPRTKKQKEKKLSVGDWILTAENLKKENDMLRRRLDEQADNYNLANSSNTSISTPYLVKESKREIRTTSDLLNFVQEIFMRGYGIIQMKNRDYGDHKNSDPFGNFRRHKLKGFLVRIDDKLARLNTFCDSGKLTVLDESVIDTIIDAANYLAIMAAYIYSENISTQEKDLKFDHKTYGFGELK